MSVSINGTNGLTFSDASTQNTSPFPGGFAFRNRIINGAMRIDQRNAGASVTPTNSQYLVDRFYAVLTQASKYTVQQNAGSVTPPVGFTKYLGVTSSSAYSVLTGDIFAVAQAIEGNNVADLGWGTANAATVTLSFWVRSSLTGTFGGAVGNAVNRSYPFTYTISAANTWEQKSVTIPGDTTGTWLSTNGIGLSVYFGLGAGSTYSGTAGVWAGSVLLSATGATSVVGTNGATFYITGVQLEKGSTATSFDYRPYGTELSLCQRYLPYLSGNGNAGIGGGYTSTLALMYFKFPVTTRVPPTGITISSPTGFYVGTSANNATTNLQFNGATTDSSILLATSSGLTVGQSQIFGFPSGQYIYWNGCEL